MDGLPVDRERLRQVCLRFGVIRLEIFGSYARGEARADSDVDLLYVLESDAQLGFGIFDLEQELTTLFGRDVDLVSRQALHPMLRDGVESDAVEIYAA